MYFLKNAKLINKLKFLKIVKIHDTKSYFFKVNKIDKYLSRLIKKKRERAQISKMKNEKGETTTNMPEIQKVIR